MLEPDELGAASSAQQFAKSSYEYDNLSRETATWREEQGGKGERFRYDVTKHDTADYNASGVQVNQTLAGANRSLSYAYTPDKLNRASVTENGTATNFNSPSRVNQYASVGTKADDLRHQPEPADLRELELQLRCGEPAF